MPQTFTFEELKNCGLIVDALYKGGQHGSVLDDPIGPLVGGGNQGGFRYAGSPQQGTVRFCILYSELADPDWPDELNFEAGTFIYYGDNKRPGHELHDTTRRGNVILRDAFANLHTAFRERIPPFFVFTKGQQGRDVVFRGVAVPGAVGIPQTEDLVAIWKTKGAERFQNYRAVFTILDIPTVSRSWINEVKRGNARATGAPRAWLDWSRKGKYEPLIAQRISRVRTREMQSPSDEIHRQMLAIIVEFFKRHPQREYAFERCAAELVRIMDSNVTSIELTRPWKDGGRDGLGKYRIGPQSSEIEVDFALEAKCYAKDPCGVRETARLIARLRHRQFGVFVTTTYVHSQAYQEIVEDEHPVLILAGGDICQILQKAGYSGVAAVQSWLETNFS